MPIAVAKKRGPRVARRGRENEWLALAAFTAVTAMAPAIGMRSSPADPRIAEWYDRLEKAPFTPPDAAFGPVWTALYALIATSGWRVWRAPPSHARTRALALWATQLGLNTLWTPLFFGERRTKAAFADILLLCATVSAYTMTSRKVDRGAARMMIPYLAWLTLATSLNEEIVRRN
jgi:tryptophan-rich sensory protein